MLALQRRLHRLLRATDRRPVGGAATRDGDEKLVQLHVSQLRKALGAQVNLLTRGRGYELRLGPEDLDVSRFQRLVAAGAPARGARPCGAARRSTTSPASRSRRRRSTGSRNSGWRRVELATRHDLAAGRHARCVGELERLVLEEPLRETPGRAPDAGPVPLRTAGRRPRGVPARPVLSLVEGQRRRARHGAAPLCTRRSCVRTLDAGSGAADRPARRPGGEPLSRPNGRSCASPRTTWRANVFELQAARARHETDGASSSSARTRAWPVRGRGRRVLLRARAARRGARGALIGAPSRVVGARQRQVVGPECRRAAALAGGVLPGSERWPSPVLRPGKQPMQELDA